METFTSYEYTVHFIDLARALEAIDLDSLQAIAPSKSIGSNFDIVVAGAVNSHAFESFAPLECIEACPVKLKITIGFYAF